MRPAFPKKTSPWFWLLLKLSVVLSLTCIVLFASSPNAMKIIVYDDPSHTRSSSTTLPTPDSDESDSPHPGRFSTLLANVNNSLLHSVQQQCTDSQRQTIRSQLPPQACEEDKGKYGGRRCSFSLATRCSDAIWFAEFWKEAAQRGVNRPTAIYVGCNKGMDAVNTLRMISENPEFDKSVWQKEILSNVLSRNQTIVPGACNQENAPQFDISTLQGTARTASDSTASVFCIEAMPQTANQLNRSSHQLGWQNSFVVTNAAISSTDGVALFPSGQAGQKIGVEHMGLGDCLRQSTKHLCAEVQQYTLDTYFDKFLRKDSWIDFLSIDVEGYDWDVLMSASKALERVKYLEFEFHRVGKW
jgi:FkbM family methyltransferase